MFHLVHQFDADVNDDDGVQRHLRVRVGYTDGALHHAAHAEVAMMIVQHVGAMANAVTSVVPQVNQWGNNSYRINIAVPPPNNAMWFEFDVINEGLPYHWRVSVYHIEFVQQQYKSEAKRSLYIHAMKRLQEDFEKRGGGGKSGGSIFG